MRARGFSMIEVLGAAVVLAVGIAGATGALAAMSNTEIRLRESEKMNRLAIQKMDELLALGNIETADTSGNFQDYNEPNYTWQLEVSPTGEEGLNAVRVIVENDRDSDRQPRGEVSTVVFTPSTSTTTGGTN